MQSPESDRVLPPNKSQFSARVFCEKVSEYVDQEVEIILQLFRAGQADEARLYIDSMKDYTHNIIKKSSFELMQLGMIKNSHTLFNLLLVTMGKSRNGLSHEHAVKQRTTYLCELMRWAHGKNVEPEVQNECINVMVSQMKKLDGTILNQTHFIGGYINDLALRGLPREAFYLLNTFFNTIKASGAILQSEFSDNMRVTLIFNIIHCASSRLFDIELQRNCGDIVCLLLKDLNVYLSHIDRLIKDYIQNLIVQKYKCVDLAEIILICGLMSVMSLYQKIMVLIVKKVSLREH